MRVVKREVGGKKGVGGECEGGAAAKCSGHDNGGRFVNLSCSSYRLYLWDLKYAVGRKGKGRQETSSNSQPGRHGLLLFDSKADKTLSLEPYLKPPLLCIMSLR